MVKEVDGVNTLDAIWLLSYAIVVICALMSGIVLFMAEIRPTKIVGAMILTAIVVNIITTFLKVLGRNI